MKPRACKSCGGEWHTAFNCPLRPRKGFVNKVKLMKPIGRQGLKYNQFRNNVAYPYLVEKYGEQCNSCGRSDLPLDVDHIKKRGSRPDLKYDLNNLQLLCRSCHAKKDNEILW